MADLEPATRPNPFAGLARAFNDLATAARAFVTDFVVPALNRLYEAIKATHDEDPDEFHLNGPMDRDRSCPFCGKIPRPSLTCVI